jgi:iduronate 2-sulfatase
VRTGRQKDETTETSPKPVAFRLPLMTTLSLLAASMSTDAPAAERLNVLFIAADDLQCDLGCYGHPLAKTPHLVTLPQYFKRHGYFTQTIGKIFHNWHQAIDGDPASWSVAPEMHYAAHNSDMSHRDGEVPLDTATASKTERRDVPDEAYFDGRIAAKAVEALRQLKVRGEPFLLAVGFWKPHLPFNPPTRYWDLYRREDVPLPARPNPPGGVPALALHNGRELLRGLDRELMDAEVRELRYGYPRSMIGFCGVPEAHSVTCS